VVTSGSIAALLGLFVGGFIAILAQWVVLRNKTSQRDREKKDAVDIPEGSSRCCQCGSVYKPLNDPDYIPEVNLCRDCLWILYYKTFFKEE